MKICKKCGDVSNDDSPVCKNPNCYGNKFDNYEEVKNIAINKLNHKIKVKKTLSILVVLVYSMIIGVLIGANVFYGSLTFTLILKSIMLIGVAVACIRFTGEVFVLINIFSIKNVDENHMSDMYDTYLKTVGIVCALFSILLLVKALFFI